MTAIVGITGPRAIAPDTTSLISQVVFSLGIIKTHIAVGCASGVDRIALSNAVLVEPQRVTVFAVFGPKSEGSFGSSNVKGVRLAAKAGAKVNYFAGGDTDSQPVLRLIRRSQAMIKYVADVGGAGSGIFGFVNKLPDKEFARDKNWPSCGSGTWATIAAANYRGLKVVVFPVEGLKGEDLPLLPGGEGEWTPLLQNKAFSSGYIWIHP